MNRKFIKYTARILAMLLAIALIITSFIIMPFAGEADTLNKNDMDSLETYIKYLHENYKDDIEYEKLIDGAFNGATEVLGDKFSVYYPKPEDRQQFVDAVDGSFEGVGVTISMLEGGCTVISTIVGSPAQKNGIREGDIIRKINGTDVKGLDLSRISASLRGQKGTRVTVSIEREGQLLDFNIVRDVINNLSVVYDMLDDETGLIKILGFDSDTNSEFRQAKIALTNRGAERLIIDIRDNPGGLVDQAIDVADQILEKGDITHFESRGKEIKTYKASPNEKVYQPLCLMINRNTASAAEILTGALKDNGAAKLVGETTYGKGIAQQIGTLPDGRSFKISAFYFLTPDGDQINGKGITPDVTVLNTDGNNANSASDAEYAGFAPMSEKKKSGLWDTGLNVYGAQQRLGLIGYDVKVTGTMDERTYEAVKSFQQREGLYPYGVLDYTTMDRLDAIAGGRAGAYGEISDMQLEKALEIVRAM